MSALFDQTLRHWGITGKELSNKSGVSENHISEFRRGKGDITTNVLWKLLQAMEQIAPGSGNHFFYLILGQKMEHPSVGERLEQLIEAADDEETERAMLAIARKWKGSRSVQALTV
ncbi:XRE family transcriptional regulator [Funiculus sociatus GB2-A5]|uniref:XRE family transcriptional regulator n=2 Tax=Funiculus TaxID=2886342 RepID=A0ABV0JUP3_9CYAN|nr:helix-turn-helix transcriptional regulator [Trichocoleus sp. FACHB-6]